MEAQLLDWPVVENIIRKDSRVLLYGPPGTGKTTAAVNAGVATDRKVWNVTLTDETPAAELRGHWVPGDGGRWNFHLGSAMRAFLDGDLLILNEVDKASLDCLDFLHALLDDPSVSQFELPTGETVRPGATFGACATTNVSPETLPDAIQDRFGGGIYIGTPHPDAVASLPEDLRTVAVNMVGREPVGTVRPVTIRTLKKYANLREHVGAEHAAIAVWAHRASELMDALTLASAR